MIVQEEDLFERCSAIFLLGGLKKLSATLLEIDVMEELSGCAISIKEVEISRASSGELGIIGTMSVSWFHSSFPHDMKHWEFGR